MTLTACNSTTVPISPVKRKFCSCRHAAAPINGAARNLLWHLVLTSAVDISETVQPIDGDARLHCLHSGLVSHSPNQCFCAIRQNMETQKSLSARCFANKHTKRIDSTDRCSLCATPCVSHVACMCVSVSLSVCALVTRASPAKTAEPIEMPFEKLQMRYIWAPPGEYD